MKLLFDTPLKVASLMRGFAPAWFVAGGWAIDLFLGEVTRPHDDVEIAVFRRDQLAAQEHLSEWTLKKVAGGELSSWKKNEFLELPVHAVHCFNERAEPPFLEVLLNEFDGEKWRFRRDERVTKPFSELFLTSDSGINYLRPEVVLLYKSKNPRGKDERDFEKALPRLDGKSVAWLRDALTRCDGGNAWLEKIRGL